MAKGTDDELHPDEANYRSKITIATIGGSPERAKTEKKRVHVAEIYGIATGVKMVENPMDDSKPFTAITGNFEAVNMHDGETWRSGVLYLPGGFHELILGMLDELEEAIKLPDDDPRRRSKFDKASVQFALAIDSEPADNPAGYTYVAKNLLPISKADPLSALREAAHAALSPPAKALSAPEKTAA